MNKIKKGTIGKTKKVKKLVLQILELVFVIGIIYSGINIFLWFKSNGENKEIMEEVGQVVKKNESAQENGGSFENKYKYEINFEGMKNKNSDTVAWLKVENTNIEFPIVQTTNNSYYLTYNFNKEYNIAGWPFLDYKNKLDGTDKNIVIYGHNMLDGSMFGTLEKVLTPEWYESEENKFVTFITESEYGIYEVFSVYKIQVEDYYIKTKFSENEFSNFIQTLTNRSIKDFEVNVPESGTILTLSTCASNNSKQRIVLHAVKVTD